MWGEAVTFGPCAEHCEEKGAYSRWTEVPVGAVVVVPGGRFRVMRVSTSSGVPSSMGEATAPAAGFVGPSGKPIFWSKARACPGLFCQLPKFGLGRLATQLKGACRGHGADGVVRAPCPR